MNQILFNALHYTKNGAGISRYTQELLRQFQMQEYPIDILLRKEWEDEWNRQGYYFATQKIKNSTERIIEEQYCQLGKYKQYELIHFPDYASPIFYKGKKIVTIHDMAMHTMRSKYTKMQNLTKNILLRDTIKKADRFICDSYFAKEELLKYYPQVEDRIKVIHLGIQFPEYLFSQVQEDEIIEKMGIPREYILYVGTIAPHKNIEQLIVAYRKLKLLGCKHKLVIAGKRGWMEEKIMQRAREEGIEEDVIFTGFASEDALEVLYRRATFFVSVSLYEGFGFPPLEAMGRGCPVLVSDIGAFRETCEDHVLYCDPNDVEDIARQMERLLGDNELRSELIRRGLEQVKKFNWEKTAQETYQLYEEVLGEK